MMGEIRKARTREHLPHPKPQTRTAKNEKNEVVPRAAMNDRQVAITLTVIVGARN